MNVSVSVSNLDQQAGELGAALQARITELGDGITKAIRTNIHPYAAALTDKQLHRSIVDILRFILHGLEEDQDFDTRQAAATGTQRAIAGIPLESVMEAYRIIFRYVWDAVIEESRARPQIGTEAVLRAIEKVWLAQHVFTDAMAEGYRQQRTRQQLQDENERAALVEALLLGPTEEYPSVWEICDLLRIPQRGWYRVVAVQLPSLGRTALPEIESKLKSLDITSAWRLTPELQLGIVVMRSRARDKALVELINRVTTTRAGISPLYDDLTRTHQATRYARLALKARIDSAHAHVTEFNDTLLGRVAVSSPQTMRHLAQPLLSKFEDLAPDERRLLINTFRQWVFDGGSVSVTAEHLFCHPNTVRHRLKRIEERTQRSVTHPYDLAELCLVFEIDQRLPEGAEPD